jgi:hypothetical protein
LVYQVTEATINPHALLLAGIEGGWLRVELAASGELEAELALAADPDEQEDRLTIYLATSPAECKRMKTADTTNDPELYGLCSGFPATAIAAYVARQSLAPPNFPELYTPEVAAFGHYMLSKAHAATELATAQRWARAVQRADRPFYDTLLALAVRDSKH